MNTNNLRKVRLERGMSLSELSRRTKISRVTLTKIENGDTNPTIKTVTSICNVLDRSPNDIFFTNLVNQELQR